MKKRLMGFSKAAALAVLVFLCAVFFSAPAESADVVKGSPTMQGHDAPPQGADKDVTVTSNSMEADRNNKLVTFRGDVVAEGEFLICSDELYVYYDDSDDVKDIVAKGHVRIVQGDKKAAGGEAHYDKVKRVVVLTGKPVAKQCSDTVKGEKITFYLDSNNMAVEGGGGQSRDKRVVARVMPKSKCVESGDSEEFRCAVPR